MVKLAPSGNISLSKTKTERSGLGGCASMDTDQEEGRV